MTLTVRATSSRLERSHPGGSKDERSSFGLGAAMFGASGAANGSQGHDGHSLAETFHIKPWSSWAGQSGDHDDRDACVLDELEASTAQEAPGMLPTATRTDNQEVSGCRGISQPK